MIWCLFFHGSLQLATWPSNDPIVHAICKIPLYYLCTTCYISPILYNVYMYIIVYMFFPVLVRPIAYLYTTHMQSCFVYLYYPLHDKLHRPPSPPPPTPQGRGRPHTLPRYLILMMNTYMYVYMYNMYVQYLHILYTYYL